MYLLDFQLVLFILGKHQFNLPVYTLKKNIIDLRFR